MYINRLNQKVIFESFERQFITALLGPRRVGKSTLALEFSKRHPERTWVFLNMDKREERLRIEADQLQTMIQESAKQQLGHNNKIWIIIDEAQKCPLLFNQIKILYDQ